MRAISLLLIFAMPFVLVAQSMEYGNFKIVETELIYQKVFHQDSITADKLMEFLKSAPGVTNVESVDGKVTADLTELIVDYKKFQFSQVSVPAIIQTGRYSGKLTADVKPGKYRVTLKSIQMTGDIGYKKIPAPESLTRYACGNSGTVLQRDWCKPNTLGLLDMAVTDRFLYRDIKKDEEW